jgi:hypothetical protein
MADKRRKRKRRGQSSGGGGGSSGGGVMQSIRSGFRQAAGAETPPKASTTSNVIWALILAVAVGVFLWRWFG